MQVRESRLRDLLRLLVWVPGRTAVGLLPEKAALRLFALCGTLQNFFWFRFHGDFGPFLEIAGTFYYGTERIVVS